MVCIKWFKQIHCEFVFLSRRCQTGGAFHRGQNRGLRRSLSLATFLLLSEHPGTGTISPTHLALQVGRIKRETYVIAPGSAAARQEGFIRVGTGQRGIKVYNFRGNVTAEFQLSESSFSV